MDPTRAAVALLLVAGIVLFWRAILWMIVAPSALIVSRLGWPLIAISMLATMHALSPRRLFIVHIDTNGTSVDVEVKSFAAKRRFHRARLIHSAKRMLNESHRR